MFDVKILENNNIEFSGRLDATQTEQAEKILEQVNTSCTLDMKSLEYISSAGLGILLMHQKRLKDAGHAFRLINLNKHVRDVFMLTGFDQIFEIM
ncbi:MAG: STAS domain-containing protein [Bacteroidota bacterium]|nr:STAS domain-containing protein [Bacteroidota bacterium]